MDPRKTTPAWLYLGLLAMLVMVGLVCVMGYRLALRQMDEDVRRHAVEVVRRELEGLLRHGPAPQEGEAPPPPPLPECPPPPPPRVEVREVPRNDERHEYDPYARDPAAMEAYRRMVQGLECDDRPREREDFCDTRYSPEEMREVQDRIWRAQHPPDCRKARLFFFTSQRDDGSGLGVGCVVHALSAALGQALADGRVLVPVGNFFFSEVVPYVCPERTLWCYFYPITNCTLQNSFEEGETLERSARIIRRSDLPPYPERMVWNDNTVYELNFGYWLPEYQSTRSIFWWRSVSSKYLLRPREWLLEHTERERRRTFPPDGKVPHPLLTIHVRHGDKFREAPPLNLSAYVDAAKRSGILEGYGVRDIFLSTEDQAVVSDARLFPEFRWHITDLPRLNLAPAQSAIKLGRLAEAAISFSQLLIGIEGDFYALTRSSNWGRLLDELRKTNGKARTHLILPANDIDIDT